MAIRSGSPGLKYPLPNNTMAQQSAAAASAGGSASASAYGANRSFAANKMRVQADLANSAAERQQRAEQAYYDRGFRAQQNFYDREHQAGAQLQSQDFRADQAELDRQFTAERDQAQMDFRANESQLDRDFTAQRDAAAAEQDQAAFEAKRDAEIEEGIRTGKLEIPWELQQQQRKLDADMAIIKTNPQWQDPAWRAEFQRKYDAAKREILRSARAPQAPTATEAANSGTTYFDPSTGKFEKDMAPGRTPGRVGKDGEFTPIQEPPDTSKEDQRKQSWLDKRADSLMNEVDEKTGKPLYTPEEAARQAGKDWDSREKGFQPPQPPTPGQPAPGRSVEPPPPPAPSEELPPNVPPLPPRGAGPGGTWQGPLAPSPNPVPPAGAGPGGQWVGPPPSAGAGPGGTWQGAHPQATTEAQFTDGWSKLPPGGTMVGPDGKVYVKKKA